MSETTRFITNNLFQVVRILELMRQPNGTSIEELCKELHINRRSVFRLLKTIEQKFHEPFSIQRTTFGGAASYRLLPAFIEKLSGISLPELSLTFTQAAFIYLVLNDVPISKSGILSSEIDQLWKSLETFYNQ